MAVLVPTFNTEFLDLITDLTSAELADISNAIYEKSFAVGKLPESHTVVEGIREGNVIPILSTNPSYTSFPYKDMTNCNTPVCDLVLGFGAKVWQVGAVACRVPICINTFDENFLAFWGKYKRLFGDTSLDGALMAYITGKFQTELDAALWRIGWFGERGYTPTNSPNYPLLRPLDGIFTQAEAGEGIKIPITENTSGTGGAPVPLTGEAAYAYLAEAYNEAMLTPWFDLTTAQFEMTKAMAAAIVVWLNNLNDTSMYNCQCLSATQITGKRMFTIEGLSIFGIPVIVRQEFDGVITALSLGRPYRALLTSKDNIVFGTPEIDQLTAFDIWYSKDDGQVYMEGGAQLAASLVTDEYVYLGAETV